MVHERIEASVAVFRFHGIDNCLPTDFAQNQNRHGDQARAHHNELQKIGYEYREHAAENRVHSHAYEEHGHHNFEIADVESGDKHEKLAADPQKHAHIQ